MPLLLLFLLLALCLFQVTLAAEAPKLVVEGATNEQEANIRAFVPMGRHDCELPPFRERSVIRSTSGRVEQALRALGHYQSVTEIRIDRVEACWELVVTVEAGPQVQIVDVDLRVLGPGAEDPAFMAVIADPGLQRGDPLRHDAYDALRSRLTRIAADRGYFDARMQESRLEVDPVRNEARVILHYETGPRYRLGSVQLEQSILTPEFAGRLIPFEPGDPYSSSHLIRLQRNLSESGYFQTVRVRPMLDQAEDLEVPIIAEVEPRPRTAYEFRLGYSTDLGPRAGVNVDLRYVNRRGHRFNAELEASVKRSGLGLSYDIPLADPLSDRINLFASYRTEDTGTTQSDRIQVGASRPTRRSSGWQTTPGIRFEHERYTIAGVTDTSRLLLPYYRANRTRSDDLLYPRSGHRVELLAQGAYDGLGSSVSFVQTKASAKTVQGLGKGRLLLRADMGVTAVSNIDAMPGSLRFFAGGDTSVRGFGFQKIGPTNAEGRVIGGRHLLTGSVEYDHPIGTGPWGVAVFVDAGNALNDFDDYRPKLGFGVGVRWRSPVGPIRLDLAHAPESDDRFRIHFTMGPDL